MAGGGSEAAPFLALLDSVTLYLMFVWYNKKGDSSSFLALCVLIAHDNSGNSRKKPPVPAHGTHQGLKLIVPLNQPLLID